jgi:molecular chaperone DnaK
VAHGAALRAGLILARHEGEAPAFKIKNVNSHSLGVVATDAKTRRPRNAILIPRNTPLPVVARRVFKTQKASQKSILVQIVEGESLSPDDCSQLGKCSVRHLPAGLPAQTPIEVRFRYEENGLLTVNVKVEGTDKHLQHEITRENTLMPEELDSWRKYISNLEPAAPAPAAASSREARQVQPAAQSAADAIDFTPVEEDGRGAERKKADRMPHPGQAKMRWE